MPNLRHLKVFSLVAQAGSISAAAPLIHLSQPAITQAVANLERVLGASLLIRHRSGVVLTQSGEAFLKRVRRALAMLKTGCIKAASHGVSGPGQSGGRFDHMVTVQQLNALITVSDAGNFSLAALELGLSQPSVHRLARDLERTAQMTLFERQPRGINLTEPAHLLVQFSRLAFSELEQGFQELDDIRHGGRGTGTVVVGTLPLVRTGILPNAINRFTRQHPDAQIQIVDGPYDDLLFGLRHGNIDFMLGALRDGLAFKDVMQERLFSDRLAVVGRAGHPLAKKKNPSKAELAEFPWVIPRTGTPTRSYFDGFFSTVPKAEPKRILEASSLILIRGLLRDSDRLTMISKHQIAQEMAMGTVEGLSIELNDQARSIGITKRKDWVPTRVQQRFIDTVTETVDEMDHP